MTNKDIWKAIKPFLANKVSLENSGIMFRDDEKMISGEKKLVKLWNNHYINIAVRSCGIKPENVEFVIGSTNQK